MPSELAPKSSELALQGGRTVGVRQGLAAGEGLSRVTAWETLDGTCLLCLRERAIWYAVLPRPLTQPEGHEFVHKLLRFCNTGLTLMGSQEWTQHLEPWLGSCRLTRRVAYHWMERPRGPVVMPDDDPRFQVRWVGPSDARFLFGLQEAYEKEEVLSHPSEFRPLSSFWFFHRQLQTQWNLVLEENGVPLAKAGTNALISDWGQLGGVFTWPDRRGQGLQKRLMAGLIERLGQSGRSACLFVKQANLAARYLYESVGFHTTGPFEITYWVKER